MIRPTYTGNTVVILASGGGSNAQRIINYLRDHTTHSVVGVFSNKKSAGVLDKARAADIEGYHYPSKQLPSQVLTYAREHKVSAIILAGYLQLIPESLIDAYHGRIVNIHPSLLPKYGGHGMYGRHVHQAVYDAREEYSGMTIHLVNKEYDKGKILSQAMISVDDCQSPEEIAARVLKLEHFHYPRGLAQWLDGLNPPV